MKTIFRYANVGLMLAAFFAVGAMPGFAQDPATACSDTAGANEMRATFEANYAGDVDQRKIAVEAGKQYVTKFGACPEFKEFTDYLNKYLPGIEAKITADTTKAATEALYQRFNASVKTSTFDETYASGKEILAKQPDQLDVVISLGSIGYDESYKGNFKYNDDTLKYAKQAIAELNSGKTSKTFGLFQWSYKNKDNALGWLNYTVGYITQVAKKNKKEALPFLFKASQANSETNKNPIPFELIGDYYFDELNKITEEIKVLAADQKETDTPEIAKEKVEVIKAKVALANGTAERAMDAFSRAYSLAATTPAAKLYRDKMRKNVEDAYKLRFAKTVGVDEWIAGTMKKAFPDPLTPVAPISDVDPGTTTTTSTTTAPATTPASTSKPVDAAPVKPAPAPATKRVSAPPVTKPAAGMKPQAKVVKKRTVKRKVV